MNKRKALIWLAVLLGGIGLTVRTGFFGKGENVVQWFPPAKWLLADKADTQAQASRAVPAVAVEVAKAVRKKTPVILEALGNVTTIASVAIRPRLDDEIVGVHFQDGAFVKQGDLLISLDARAIDEVHVFVAPKLAGGTAALGAVGGQGSATIAEALRIREWRVEDSAGDLYVRGWV